MVVLERAVRFQDVDPAGIVFFAHFVTYAHEAMEHFFASLPGGYARLTGERRVGLPAVKLAADYHAPLRHGDVVRIETTVAELGRRSAVFRYRFMLGDTLVAKLLHTVVSTDLAAMKSCDMPADVRAQMAAHVDTTLDA